MFGRRKEVKVCGFDKKPCIKDECVHWVHVYGTDPQKGTPIDEAKCAFTWLPTLILETNKEVRHTCASVDVLRSDHAGASHITHQLLASEHNGILAAFERLIQAARAYSIGPGKRQEFLSEDPHSQSMMLEGAERDRLRKTG